MSTKQDPVNRVWAFIAEESPGAEGIVHYDGHPMVFADETELDTMRMAAGVMARKFEKTITLVRFDRRVDFQRFAPGDPSG